MSASVSADRQSQLDEVEFMAAMSREGEFQWEEDTLSGSVSGTLNVFLQLETVLSLRMLPPVKKPFLNKSTPLQLSGSPKAQGKHETNHGVGCQSDQVSVPSTGSTAAMKTNTSAVKSYSVLHLPPICLHFRFPSAYPSREMPEFTLSCKWLNFTQLSSLCGQLEQVWAQDPRSVVLYSWQQLLANETMSTLGITEELMLEFQDPTTADPAWDPRAVQDMDHPLHVLPFLVEYDKTQKEKLFADSFFNCEICFLSLPGSKCIRTGTCSHIHCQDCLRSHIMTKISSGDVTRVDCPSGNCEELISPNVVKRLVPRVDFERYDKLLLQRTLDGMQDIVYCPRPSCRCVTVRDDSNMAQCPRCMFSFCILCHRAWHGLSPCRLLPADLKQLWETWESLDAEDRRVLEVQYGKERLHKALQEYNSYKWIESNAKACPQCSAKIQKTHGCNKMTCMHCSSHFCWLCDTLLSRYNPYSHFRIGNSPCAGKLFEGLEGAEDDWAWGF